MSVGAKSTGRGVRKWMKTRTKTRRRMTLALYNAVKIPNQSANSNSNVNVYLHSFICITTTYIRNVMSEMHHNRTDLDTPIRRLS